MINPLGSEREVAVVCLDDCQWADDLTLQVLEAWASRAAEEEHRGARLPSMPHIDMTVDTLRRRGVPVDVRTSGGEARWAVPHHRVSGRDLVIEPDLSTASGSFNNRMNMVGTMKIVSIFCSSISRRNSSGSNRGISTSAPPRRPDRRPNEFGAEW